ncbi:MAG: hypothetical protein ABI410_22180 [Rhodoferax sp.]|uniref:hypothetical protein n=1 Tax=Rhodoferax sp. TaxID=50421 RepID=UPI0032653DCB
MSDSKPGGLSVSDFKIMALEIGEWLWGTARGAFNQKSTLSQIITDAAIGMIPLVGDVTAARDIIAVTVRLVDDPEARESVWEWVLLVVLILALIPVIGGVLKGTGRLVVKFAGDASHLATAAEKTAYMAEGAQKMVATLNRLGHGHAEKWLLKLNFADHQAAVISHFHAFMDMLVSTLGSIDAKLGPVLSGALRQRVAGLQKGCKDLKAVGARMIPNAVKELNSQLHEIQQYIRSGGETTSRATVHTATAGTPNVHMTDEARLLEEFGAKKSAKGGLVQNVAMAGDDAPDFSHIYTHKSRYPDLTKFGLDKNHFTRIEAYAGKIVNRELKEGEQIYRLFGDGGTTHGVKIKESDAGGVFWGLGKPPKDAKEWRELSAVKDEWNCDGFIVVGTVPKKANIKACVGLISEQAGEKIPGQYLRGGAMQAFITFDRDAKSVVDKASMGLTDAGKLVVEDGIPRTWIDPQSGMHFEIRPTGWTDANGIHGYGEGGTPGTVSVAPLGATEKATKTSKPNLAATAAKQTARAGARSQTSDPASTK